MASRSLTKNFIERRNSKHVLGQLEKWTEENTELGLLGGNSSVDLESGGTRLDGSDIAPTWVSACLEVEAAVETVECELRRMVGLRKRLSLVTFNHKEDSQVENDLNELKMQIGKKLQRAERLLTRKGPFEASASDSEAELRAKCNSRIRYVQKLRELMRRFHHVCKDRDLNRDRDIVGFSNEKEIDLFINNGAPKDSPIGEHNKHGKGRASISLDDMTLLDEFEAMAADDAMLEQRQSDLDGLTTSVKQVATIFKELAVLVIDQGTILDRVDYNMETVTHRTKHAASQLVRAEHHHEKTSPFKCLIALLLLIAVLLFILLYKLFS